MVNSDMMTTEDDTFNRLRRAPLSEALGLYFSYLGDKSILNIYLQDAGWTVDEIRKEIDALNGIPFRINDV